MKTVLLAAALGVAGGCAAQTASPQSWKVRNWAPPAARIYAQKLSDTIMAQHPELVSVTFHGVPPGLVKVYTMFAGSFPDRIGNADDLDDIEVITKGITVLDPKWHRSDWQKKFGVSLPLRDRSGENVGLVTYAFKNEVGGKGERDFLLAALALRDSLAAEIPNYKALFDPAD